MSEIIVLRTHYYDAFVDQLVRRLQTCRTVVAVVDERKGIVKIPDDIRKIALDPASLGLPLHPDYGWRCGDYCLYAALQTVPDASAVWLVEPDVRIHTDDPKAFFDGASATAGADFVTAWSVKASVDWMWYRSMIPFVAQPFTCMMQLCRFSHAAGTYLLEERRSLGRRFELDQLDMAGWPNDEAFVGTMLAHGGFRIATFKEHAPNFRTAGTFTFTKPTSALWLDSIPPNNAIYHPVEHGENFLARAKAYLRTAKRGEDDRPPEPDEEMERQMQIESTPKRSLDTAPK